MKNSDYWKSRFQQLENARHELSAEKINEIQEQIDIAQHAIEEKINAWYQRFALNNNISLTEAQKQLNSKELKEFKWDVGEYIKHGKENAVDQRWIKELENASARVHISRLEQIKLHTQQYVEVAFGNYNDILDNHIRDLYKQDYYHAAYEIQKGIGVGYSFAGIDEEKIDKIISKPWASDGANFSDRIWTNKNKLVDQLHTSLTQMCITGAGPDKAITDISKAMGSSKYQAGRLVMTESAYFGSLAQKECFTDLNVEKYEIVATLDSHTSDICQDMDGKVFKMSEYEAGVTAPPFHVNCRSCTCPYFDDEFAGGERAARNTDGKTYHVPGDMKYKDWHKKFIEDNPIEKLREQKNINFKSDKEQYKKYIERLGNEFSPKTLDDFQTLKYTNEKEYGILKAQYKGMKYYEEAVNNEPLITSMMKSTASSVDMELYGLKYKLKTKESYLEKIARDYVPGDNNYEINDIIRYTMGVKNPDSLVDKTLSAIEGLENLDYNTIKVKNSWLNSLDPYNGINTTIQAPNGQKFEVQYHTKESFDLKNGKMHELYEKQRAISDEFSEEYIKLDDEMFKLSEKLKIPKNIKKVK